MGASISDSLRQIQKLNLKENKTSYYIKQDEWEPFLEEAIEAAIRPAIVEVMDGAYNSFQLSELVDRTEIMMTTKSKFMRKEDAIQKLQRQRDLIDDLKVKPRFSQDFKKWRRDTEIAIEKIFGLDTRQIEDFKNIGYIPIGLAIYARDEEKDREFISGLDDAKTVLESLIQEIDEYSLEEKNSIIDKYYVDPERITELKNINNPNFDLVKLIRICEELNICFRNRCFLSVIMLVRSLIDHVPPAFGVKGFAEVANNYNNGTKSFKQSMQNLSNSSRKIADAHLHTQIRNKESLPNQVQVDFSNDLDVLLGEIVSILR